jgi:hypothetical protein
MAKRDSTQPYLDHDAMTEAEQSRFLGRGVERTKNLGHDSTVDRLTENPSKKARNYEPNSNRVIDGPSRSAGVYQRFADPQSGISSEQNLNKWSSYSQAGTYSVDGRGRDPKGRGAGSDNHLASTKNWPSFEYGADSGPGRIEKTHRK